MGTTFIEMCINITTKLDLSMEFKKKYPCTQCIFLTTKESTLAKHMKRHQNVQGEQVSNFSFPRSSDISKRIFNVYSEEFKNLRRKNLTMAQNKISLLIQLKNVMSMKTLLLVKKMRRFLFVILHLL